MLPATPGKASEAGDTSQQILNTVEKQRVELTDSDSANNYSHNKDGDKMEHLDIAKQQMTANDFEISNRSSIRGPND